MKFPTFEHVLLNIYQTLVRFYASILFAAAFTVVSFMRIDSAERFNSSYYGRIQMSLYIGFLFSIAVHVITEYKGLSWFSKLIYQLLSVGVAILFYMSGGVFISTSYLVHCFVLAVILHLIISTAPYLWERNNEKLFWQYNQLLFIRFFTAVLYSGVLYLGLDLALLAVDKLFKANIQWQSYEKLWIVIACLFNPWFFLGGFPSREKVIEQVDSYPRALKFFTQYILLTLVVIYTCILYAYGLKIFFTQTWPVGWLAYLLIGFSIAGILSLLLIWPVRNTEGNTWIVFFSKAFYMALVPLLFLLSAAIYKRVDDYGLTVLRNYLILLDVWLAGIVLYFLLPTKRNIKVIPASLGLLGIISIYPVFQTAKATQANRFKQLLEKNHLISNGKIVPAKFAVDYSMSNKISDQIEYLMELHGLESLQPFFKQNLDSLYKAKQKTETYYYEYEFRGNLLNIMGLNNNSYRYSSSDTTEVDHRFNIVFNEDDFQIPVQGFDDMKKFYWSESRAKRSDNEAKTFPVTIDQFPATLIIQNGSDSSARISLNNFILKRLLNNSDYVRVSSLDSLRFDYDSGKMHSRVYLTTIRGENKKNKIEVTSVEGYLLTRKK